MRLFFIIDNNEPHASGGGYYALFKFAEFLARRGHATRIHAVKNFGWAVPTPGYEVRYRPRLPRRGRVLRKLDKMVSGVYDRLRLEPEVRRFAPDWILGVLTESAIKAAELGRRLDIPVANFVYETPPWVREMVGEERFDREFRGYVRHLWKRTRQAYLRSAVLFPNSTLSREYASRWLNGREIAEPVYPGVDVQQMGGADGRTGTGGRAALLHVGRLAPTKNVDLLLKAWLRLDPRPELHLCGEGPEEGRLRDLVAGQEGVRFCGFLPDPELWRLFGRCDLVVAPSSFEGFGMLPMQALYFGKPCLASDIPIFRSVYGDRIEYFRNGDLEDLVRRIQALLANIQYGAQRSEAGRQFVIERFTWNGAAETIERWLAREGRA